MPANPGGKPRQRRHMTFVSPLTRLIRSNQTNRGLRYRCAPGYSKVAANAAALKTENCS